MVVWIVIGVVVLFFAAGMVSAFTGGRGRAQEVQRTCNRCGRVWHLSLAAAREQAPNRGQMAGAKMYRAGKRASLFSTRAAAAELEVQNLENRRQRVEAARSCPACGSGSFTERLVDL